MVRKFSEKTTKKGALSHSGGSREDKWAEEIYCTTRHGVNLSLLKYYNDVRRLGYRLVTNYI